MLLSEQIWSKLTTSEQISVMRVSWGMSPWVDDSSCISFQYWNQAMAKMDQELGIQKDPMASEISVRQESEIPGASIETLQDANETSDCVVDDVRKDEVVEDLVAFSESEQESSNGSSSVEKFENQVKIERAHKVFDEMSIRRTGANLHIEEIQTHQLGNSNKEVDVVEEFNKLTQMDDVEQYTEKFEELRASMLAFNPSLSEAYFMTSYISGLKQEITNLVKLSRPKTLAAVYEQAKVQFDAIQAFVKLSRHSNLEEFQGEFSCSSIQDKTKAEAVDESLEIVASSQENTADQPFAGEFSMELISCNFGIDVVTVGACHEFSKGLADFGRFSMGSLRIFSAYQLFEEMPLSGFNFSDATLLQENIIEGDRSWSFDPGGLRPFLIVDIIGLKEPLVSAQELFGAFSKKEIVWVETLLAFHAKVFVDLPSFESINSSSSFIFDPGGYMVFVDMCAQIDTEYKIQQCKLHS